jgi:FkbM family methyltransferase
MLAALKQVSISLGAYKPARALHRAFNRSERKHFQEQTELLSQFIRPGDLVFDVGANIGTRAEIMLSLGATVVAFEPQPTCAREVRARGNKRLTVIEAAVGATIGTAQLYLKKSSGQASLVAGWEGQEIGQLVVPVTTLDIEIKKFGNPVFCKIDVEGFEAEVLFGLSAAIKCLSFEFHCNETDIATVHRCLKKLSELGQYEINLIGEENSSWLLQEWVSPIDFLNVFPSCAASYGYGDIFARIRS